MNDFWPSTHTVATWNSFIDSNPKAEGYSKRKKVQVQKIQPNDIILFYIKKESKFAGCAQVTEGYFYDESERFEGDEYPCRISIEMETILSRDKWVPIHKLLDDLNLSKKYPKNKWGLFFTTEPKKFDRTDGEKILAAINNSVIN